MATGYGQIVIGPAGSGKTTYCRVIQHHAAVKKRQIHLVNLDPAAENLSNYDIDIKDLISIDDVMSELGYGPNGGLVYCLEYLLENMEWLQEQITEFGEGDYFLFDCPGQIELYSHLDIMKKITDTIKSWGFYLCAVYCIDVTFLNDCHKYISGSLVSLGSMIQLELPYMNVLTKCDKLPGTAETVDEFLETNHSELLESEQSKFDKKFYGLNKAIVGVIEDYSMIQMVPLNVKQEESIDKVLYNADTLIQFGELEEPKDMLYEEEQREDFEKPEPMI